jgi:hypothetical protein
VRVRRLSGLGRRSVLRKSCVTISATRLTVLLFTSKLLPSSGDNPWRDVITHQTCHVFCRVQWLVVRVLIANTTGVTKRALTRERGSLVIPCRSLNWEPWLGTSRAALRRMEIGFIRKLSELGTLVGDMLVHRRATLGRMVIGYISKVRS